ncbi:MAG: hypothetical protein ACI4JN_10250 [Ruminococcus sp.]
MTEAILSNIKAAFEEVCPFEVRFAHSHTPCKKGETFICIAGEDISCEKLQNESGRTRYFVDASVCITAAVPFRAGTVELHRIAAAYILPVMTNLGACITGFSQGSEQDSIAGGVHKVMLKFRLKGVYTVNKEGV